MYDSHRYFATTVALITTTGSKFGSNVMAAEWTMQVSYDPMIVAVFVHKSPTYWNIAEKKAFGVNIASEDQAELVNLAGGYSAKEIRKLGIPKVFSTYRSVTFDIPMIRGCAINAECKVIRMQKTGDHIMVLGRVVAAKFDVKKFPLIYTRGNYRRLSRSKISSGRKKVRLSRPRLDRFRKFAAGQFVFKAAAIEARRDGKTLLQKFGNDWIVPFVTVKRGRDYIGALEAHMRSLGLTTKVYRIMGISRLILTDGKSSIRANFVIYGCRPANSLSDNVGARWFDKIPKNVVLKRQLLQKA